MRIALSEGRISRWGEVLSELTPHDLQVIQAYYQVEPWGEDRADLREATMAALVAGAMSGAEVDPNDLKNYLSTDDGKDDRRAKQHSGKRNWPSPNSVAASMRQMFPGR